MKLRPEDAKLFYELFLPLLDYVNEKYHVTLKEVDFQGKSIEPRDAMEVAHFLWERTWIIDDYLSKKEMPEQQKEILSSWERCISGTFLIERHLKKGSVFISSGDNKVYLVNGIIDSWEEMLPYPTPVILEATLLPFGNVIITDGLISVYPVSFGKNVKSDFKDIYMTAKQQRSIITRI